MDTDPKVDIVFHSRPQYFPLKVYEIMEIGSDRPYPVPNGPSYELWAVVLPDVGRNPANDEQIRQGINSLGRVDLSLHPDRQALPAVLISARLGSSGRGNCDGGSCGRLNPDYGSGTSPRRMRM